MRTNVHWRAFLLQPDLPIEGVPARDFFAAKFGGAREMRRAFEQVGAVGEQVGISFDFERMHAVNTRRGHQLVAVATEHGRQLEAVDALFAAHFEQGRNVGDIDFLASLAETLQLPVGRERLRRELQADARLRDVEADVQAAAQRDIRAVPCFVAEDRYAVSGAQNETVLRRLLQVAADERHGQPIDAMAAEARPAHVARPA